MSETTDLDDDFLRELLVLISEELKYPLVSIQQLSELENDNRAMINDHATRALRTIDNVVLYQRVASGQMQLDLGPVHLGSVVQNISNDMSSLLIERKIFKEVKIQKHLKLAHVDRKVISGAIYGLWQAVIVATKSNKSSSLRCDVHNVKEGIRLTLMSNDVELENFKFSQENLTSVQPYKSVAGPAADIITAKALLGTISSKLSKVSSSSYHGFCLTLPASPQLKMV